MDVGAELIDGLSSDELGAYCAIALWNARDEAGDVNRLAAERFAGDLLRSAQVVTELRTVGLLITPAESRERDRRALDEAIAYEQRAAEEAAMPPEWGSRRWEGPWPMAWSDERPPNGAAVVYYLYDAAGKLAYIGSTASFLGRMRKHSKDKEWVRWTARDCRNRRDAYRLETGEITRHRPYLNDPNAMDSGRRSGGAFVQSELKARATRKQKRAG